MSRFAGGEDRRPCQALDCYPKAAMERAMKVQDVVLQAMAKKIT
jgi:hypothetical protein